RAVTRANALDHAGEHRRAIKAGADDVVGALVGVSDVAAGLLRVFIDGAEVAHHRQGFVAPLLFHYREVDGLAVDARRRAGLQAVDAERQFAQASGQGYRRRIAGAAAAVFFQADVDNAAKEGAGGEHHGTGVKTQAHVGDGADALAVLDNQVVDGLLEDRQVRLVFQGSADGGFIQHAVGLGARGTHRRALARI